MRLAPQPEARATLVAAPGQSLPKTGASCSEAPAAAVAPEEEEEPREDAWEAAFGAWRLECFWGLADQGDINVY